MSGMDIKDLNKSQLILLAILISFITSIATGITTVTLMEQAPSSVTVPINRVVRQTVERIEQVQGRTVTQTVVVKEEDLVVDAIGKNQGAIFTVTRDVTDDLGNKLEVSGGRGVAVRADGLVAVDAALVWSGGSFYLANESGKFKASFVSTNPAGFALLQAREPLDGKSELVFILPTAGDLSEMKAGQKVIILGETISSFILDSTKNIKVNPARANSGGLALNLDGEALGIVLAGEAGSFVPMKTILGALPGAEGGTSN
jgi:hypothetical protein